MLMKMCESSTENHCLTILKILVWSLVSEIACLMHGYKKKYFKSFDQTKVNFINYVKKLIIW